MSDTPYFWLDKERFFSMFGQPPKFDPFDDMPSDGKPNARVPKFNEEGLYEQSYEGYGDED